MLLGVPGIVDLDGDTARRTRSQRICREPNFKPVECVIDQRTGTAIAPSATSRLSSAMIHLARPVAGWNGSTSDHFTPYFGGAFAMKGRPRWRRVQLRRGVAAWKTEMLRIARGLEAAGRVNKAAAPGPPRYDSPPAWPPGYRRTGGPPRGADASRRPPSASFGRCATAAPAARSSDPGARGEPAAFFGQPVVMQSEIAKDAAKKPQDSGPHRSRSSLVTVD